MTRAREVFGPLHDLLLARLSNVPGLLFVGKREYIDYLADFFGAASLHSYVSDDEPVCGWEQLLPGRNAVVATGDDEDAVAAHAERVCARLGNPLRVVRLFGDLFVNSMTSNDLWQMTTGEPALPKVAYAILGTPRCGSEFLCEALTSTQVAGYPTEHLRSQSEVLTKYSRFDTNRYLRIAMWRSVTPNGVFGTKLVSHFFMDHIKICPELERTLAKFKFVRLLRKDIVDQAISALLASLTGVYHLREGLNVSDYAERLSRVRIRQADLRHLDLLCHAFAAQNKQMDEFLVKHGITPLVLSYEEVTEHPLVGVNAILSFLNISTKIECVSVSVKRTRSDLSDAIRAIYLKGVNQNITGNSHSTAVTPETSRPVSRWPPC
jgi:trehalose 2-sulfotransferase